MDRGGWWDTTHGIAKESGTTGGTRLNGAMWHLSLCNGLVSFSMTFSRFIHVVVYVRT